MLVNPVGPELDLLLSLRLIRAAKEVGHEVFTKFYFERSSFLDLLVSSVANSLVSLFIEVLMGHCLLNRFLSASPAGLN